MSEETKEIAEISDEVLAELVAQNSKLQEKENEGEGIKADYLLLAKSGTKALSKMNKELYIQGLAQGDIFLQKEKVNLGSELKVVPLAFVTLYQEKTDTSKDAKFVSIWSKEQATTFPLAEGSFYNRQLPNGNVLIPVNWVMVEVLRHKEIEHGVIAFKSTGAKIWKKWKEDAKERKSPSATLVYKIHEEAYKNEQYDWTDFGFDYVENLLETDKAEAVFCLKKSNAIREAYEKSTLVGNHDVASLTATPKAVAQIEDASETEESEDTEDMGF